MAASAKGQWIFAAHLEARSEWELTGFVGGALLNATLDRTFIDENDRRWIIDFKTSEHGAASLPRFGMKSNDVTATNWKAMRHCCRYGNSEGFR